MDLTGPLGPRFRPWQRAWWCMKRGKHVVVGGLFSRNGRCWCGFTMRTTPVSADLPGRSLSRSTTTTKGAAMTGADLIAAERQRQISEEGYSPEHDAEHDNASLAWAAVCYAAPETVYRIEVRPTSGARPTGEVAWWEPWPAYWKRGNYDNGFRFEDDRVRNLVKAGALIAAEIDRLQARGA